MNRKIVIRQWKALIWIGALAFIAGLYFVFDPMQAKWMPKCMVHVLTGWDCPGCGSQRAIHALLHGDLAGAFGANALLVVLAPFIFLLAVSEFILPSGSRLFRILHSPKLILALAVVILGWGVARNLF